MWPRNGPVEDDDIRAFICPSCSQVAKQSRHRQVRAERIVGAAGRVRASCVQLGGVPTPRRTSPRGFRRRYELDTPGIYFPTPRRLNPAIPEELRAEFSEADLL